MGLSNAEHLGHSGTCVPNYKSKNPIKLIVELYRFPHVVRYKRPAIVGTMLILQSYSIEYYSLLTFFPVVVPAYEDDPRPRAPERKRLAKIIAHGRCTRLSMVVRPLTQFLDSLYMPNSEEKKILWEYRRALSPNPKALVGHHFLFSLFLWLDT